MAVVLPDSIFKLIFFKTSKPCVYENTALFKTMPFCKDSKSLFPSIIEGFSSFKFKIRLNEAIAL